METVHTEGVRPGRIVNVVACFRVEMVDAFGSPREIKINLEKLSRLTSLWGFSYQPSCRAAFKMNVEDKQGGIKHCTMLLFSTGRVVLTAATSEMHALAAATLLVNFLSRISGMPLTHRNFRVTNIVCDMFVGSELDLDKLEATSEATVAREILGEKQFPACRIRRNTATKRKALVFDSGRVLMMGYRSKAELQEDRLWVHKLCERYALLDGTARYRMKTRRWNRIQRLQGTHVLEAINKNLARLGGNGNGSGGEKGVQFKALGPALPPSQRAVPLLLGGGGARTSTTTTTTSTTMISRPR